eukprot:TRINITY_DN32635_c0_g3_i1.p1 TRINITY_DN32635_c0_g3~~TRINITY_DN32635_c0_g3_i1.p1  ORF type:complete len:473 (+),score=39.65 TRINITY_DN32635_c0_g3_i1:77-1420(+)
MASSKNVSHLLSHDGVYQSFCAERSSNRWVRTPHYLSAPPDSSYINRPAPFADAVEAVVAGIIRGEEMSPAEQRRMQTNSMQARMHHDPRSASGRSVYVKGFEQTSKVQAASPVSTRVWLSSQLPAPVARPEDSSARCDQGVMTPLERSARGDSSVDRAVQTAQEASPLRSLSVGRKTNQAETVSTAASRSDSKSSSAVCQHVGAPLPAPRLVDRREVRRLTAASQDNVMANPRFAWGIDAMPSRPSMRQAKPPPSASSVLSADVLRVHAASHPAAGASPAEDAASCRASSRASSRGSRQRSSRSPSRLSPMNAEACRAELFGRTPQTPDNRAESSRRATETEDAMASGRRALFTTPRRSPEDVQKARCLSRSVSVDTFELRKGRSRTASVLLRPATAVLPFRDGGSAERSRKLTKGTGMCAPAGSSFEAIFPSRAASEEPTARSSA